VVTGTNTLGINTEQRSVGIHLPVPFVMGPHGLSLNHGKIVSQQSLLVFVFFALKERIGSSVLIFLRSD
jgi:hypothetical protein